MNNDINKITGPVIPLPTPFTKDFEVDYDSLSSYVNFLVSSGIKNIMTTVGTSRFNLLTGKEIIKVNETVVKAANGKAVTIVANPQTGGTMQAIQYAKHAESIGADFFLCYYPERFYGDENTFNFFKEVNDNVNIPILIHEMPMRNGYGAGNVQYSLQLLDKLMDLKNVCGLKEEALDAEYSNKIVSRFKDKAIIIGAGGGMSRYLLRDYKLGSKAFLGGIGNFIPKLELDFYSAITSGNKKEAERIVNEIEIPYFTKVVPVGWHPSLKAALSLMKLMPAHERPPMKQYTGEEFEIVKAALKSNNWI